MKRVYLVPEGDRRATSKSFVNADEALRLLRSAAQDSDNLLHFRKVWHGLMDGGGATGSSDRRVLQELAGRLAEGALRIAGTPRHHPVPAGFGAPSGGGSAPPPPAAPFPKLPVEAPLKLRPRLPDIPDIPKLPDPIADLEKLADCLVSAAEDGLPFCEQCAK